MIPWFKMKAGKKILIVREEPEGCGIRSGFKCFHANNTLYRLLWEFAHNKPLEKIRQEIVHEYHITEFEFDESLKEANKVLKTLGLLSENIQDTRFELLKIKGGV
jgi:hypothetical protein